NVLENLKSSILQLMPLSVGILPVKYLGLPLITSRLSKHHCSGLIDNVKKRLLNLKNKALSFASRLQLLNSVVSSIQVYWASTFIFPKAINAEVERLMCGFLWSHGELRKCQAKDSLWVKWINSYRLTDMSSNVRNFWDVPIRNDCSWGWRKILQCRDDLREHIVHSISDGSQTSVWFDVWSSLGPLSNFISKRDIYDAGMSLDCRVCDIVERGNGCGLRCGGGKVVNFSVSTAWADLSIVKPVVPWRKLVWFSQNVPRNTFMLWLVISQKLKTQDRMEKWLVWSHFKELVKWNFAPIALPDIVLYAVGRPINRHVSELCGIIRDNVRLRLMSWKIKKSVQVMEAAGIWDFGVNECNDGKRNGACWADDGSWMAWMFWASFFVLGLLKSGRL
ncbi:zf-RVT domain-containing protein, partial [Tanacetum coccineum]